MSSVSFQAQVITFSQRIGFYHNLYSLISFLKCKILLITNHLHIQSPLLNVKIFEEKTENVRIAELVYWAVMYRRKALETNMLSVRAQRSQ